MYAQDEAITKLKARLWDVESKPVKMPSCPEFSCDYCQPVEVLKECDPCRCSQDESAYDDSDFG